MSGVNWIAFAWQMSFVISVVTFLYGIITTSWKSMIVSFITFLPIAYYFNGANNAYRMVAFIPILTLIVALYFWRNKKAK